jgi:RNA polymerase sigma factor (sigma-70 family)
MSDATPVRVRAAPAGPRRLLTDSRLARLAASGDTAAFEAIFARHHQEVYRYCRAIVGTEHDAEDALQNTMAAALRSLPGESREIALKPWLFRVAHNESISILRRRETPVAETEQVDRAIGGVDVEVESRGRLRQLVADLRSLPERQRSALVMRELSGLGYDQIGAALDTSGAAARQTVYEARVALADLKEGREMDCDAARLAISRRDGRILRGRRIRAHLRGCESCRDFRAGIGGRRADLAALCPPLPALAASGVLAGLLGASSGGGGAAGLAGASSVGAAKGGAAAGALAGAGGAGGGGGLGAAAGASVAVKAASVIAAVAVGAGAASATGVVNLPLLGGSGSSDSASRVEPAPATKSAAPAGVAASSAPAARHRAIHRSGSAASDRHSRSNGSNGNNGRNGHGQATSQSNPAHGAPPPGQAVSASHDNPNPGAPPTAASNNGNGSGTGNAYGQSHSNAGGSANGAAHRSPSSNTGGNSTHSSSGSHSTGPPPAPPGQAKPPPVKPPSITTPKPPKPPLNIPGQGNGAGNGGGHAH